MAFTFNKYFLKYHMHLDPRDMMVNLNSHIIPDLTMQYTLVAEDICQPNNHTFKYIVSS